MRAKKSQHEPDKDVVQHHILLTESGLTCREEWERGEPLDFNLSPYHITLDGPPGPSPREHGRRPRSPEPDRWAQTRAGAAMQAEHTRVLDPSSRRERRREWTQQVGSGDRGLRGI
jgi:hypothetical protein